MGRPKRGSTPTPYKKRRAKAEEAVQAARRVKVWELRTTGASIVQIAKALQPEYPRLSASTVWRDIGAVTADLRARTLDLAQTERELDLARIDKALVQVMAQVNRGNMRAVDSLTRLVEQRAKLLGYYAPTRFDLTTNGQPFAITLEVVQGVITNAT